MHRDNLLISNLEEEKRNLQNGDMGHAQTTDQYHNLNPLQIDNGPVPQGLISVTNSNLASHNLMSQQVFHQHSHTQDIRMIKESNNSSKISMVKNQTFARAGLDLTANTQSNGF